MKKQFLHLLVWMIIISANLPFIYNFALNYFNINVWRESFGPLLTLYIIFGIVAILVGPLQFFQFIRKKYPRVNRVTGREYLLSVLIVNISATIIAINHTIIDTGRVVFGTGIIGLAVASFSTTGMAFWAIKNRNFVQHREWMVKSFVVTCGFTTFRIVAFTLNRYIQLDGDQMLGIMEWACWSVPLLVAEVFLQANKMNMSSVTLAKASR